MKLAPGLTTLGDALSATWLAGAQPPGSAPAPSSSPPPVYSYYPAPGAEPQPPSNVLPAPRRALELTVSTGYTQGFGQLSEGVGLPSVVAAGFGIDFGIGYRISPRWAVLWAGQYQRFTAERARAAEGFTSTVGVQYHFAPTRRVDPWIDLGAGYRFLWEYPTFGPALETHGFQLAHLRAGIDFRPDEQIAIGPIIGADATMFRWQDRRYFTTEIPDTRVSTFIYAGLQGRFDLGGGARSVSVTSSQR
jgi:hypothetical protein